MSTPDPFRQMLALLVGVVDVPAATTITLYPAGETGPMSTVRIDADGPDAAREWRTVLHLDALHEYVQPYPLAAAEPDHWSASAIGERDGVSVHICHQEAYTAEHEARWIARGGLRAHPRTVPVDAGEATDV